MSNFRNLAWLLLALPTLALGQEAEVPCPAEEASPAVQALVESGEKITAAAAPVDESVYPNINDAIAARVKAVKPVREITTKKEGLKFPSYSACPKTFFRVVTISPEVDKIIRQQGWLSGYDRGEAGKALPPSAPLSERIIQYVGVKNENRPFPRNSTIVGIMEDPIRTLSVGWHTGYTEDTNKYMRMDEIEIGSCAKAPECRTVVAHDSSEVFRRDNERATATGGRMRSPRYSTEGEWAVEFKIPASCVVSSYRIRYQKVDNVQYRGSY